MMKLKFKFLMLLCGLCPMLPVFAHGPVPVSLHNVPVPPVPGLLDGADPIVINKTAAIALGKALFWDVNIGSDGMACGSCHFHAGADGRIKNQINPGAKSALPSGQTFDTLRSGSGGPNHVLSAADFPLHRFTDPTDKFSAIDFTTDDVVASAGTFSGQFLNAPRFTGNDDECSRSADSVFHVNGVGTRRVEPRNAPTVINAVFNHRNFWDGRANNIFNGSSPWGERDPGAGVWVKVNARTVSKQKLHLENSSLASLATGPGLSDTEMSCRQRKWQDIGRKLLLRQPLQNQKVHYEDSVLGPLSASTVGNLKNGLNTTYKNLITQAFNQKYWAFSGIGQFGAPAGQTPYTQMEANFSMFFGLALQLYQSTLISDQSPFDLSPLDANLRPTWTNVVGATPAETTAKRAQLTRGGNLFFNNHCNLCHTGPSMSLAAVATNAALLTPTAGATFGPPATPIAYGPNAFGPGYAAKAAGMTQYVNVVTRDYNVDITPVLMDLGFVNTAVGDPNADPGIGGIDDFGNPLSFSAQYVDYLLDNAAGVHDAAVKNVRSCDFIASLAIQTDSPEFYYYTTADGLIADGSREGVLRNQNCADPATAFIPSVAAARAGVAGPKMAFATKAAFKVPTLRNIELTGPYMHNGSMATLEQVLEFYARQGNFYNENLHFQVSGISSSVNSPANRADLIAYLKSFTDERVRYQKAPFDHPEVVVPHGQVGDEQFVTPGNPLHADLAKDETLVVPAVGANGTIDPVLPFERLLQ
jgi:cytochrome c peroxidase